MNYESCFGPQNMSVTYNTKNVVRVITSFYARQLKNYKDHIVKFCYHDCNYHYILFILIRDMSYNHARPWGKPHK